MNTNSRFTRVPRVRELAIATALAAVTMVASSGLVSAAPKPCPKTVVVTDAGDDGSPGQLRSAIEQVCNGGKVELAPTLGTIVLWAPIPVEKNIKVFGAGHTLHAARETVFVISTAGTLVVSDAILEGAPAPYPAIEVSGSAALKNVTVTGFHNAIWAHPGSSVTLGQDTVVSGNFTDHWAEGGAGIYNDGGSVTLKENAAVRDNVAYACFPGLYGSRFAWGGGIYNKGGSIALEDHAAVSGNEIWHCDPSTWPSLSGWGGGIYSADGVVLVSGYAQISGNHAGTGGGVAASGSSSVTLAEHAAITGNDTSGGGGGIYLHRTSLTLYDAASISGNTANANGGGVLNASGTVTLNGTATITGNTASGHGGGIYNWAVSGQPAPQVILNDYGSVTANTPDDMYFYP